MSDGTNAEEFDVQRAKQLSDTPRQLSEAEQQVIARAKRRWFPDAGMDEDAATLPERMASPGREGLAKGLLAGGGGALLGAFLSHMTPATTGAVPAAGDKSAVPGTPADFTSSALLAGQGLADQLIPGSMSRTGKGAILGGLALGLPAAALAYLSRRQENRKLKDYATRLPAGATLGEVPGYGSAGTPSEFSLSRLLR